MSAAASEALDRRTCDQDKNKQSDERSMAISSYRKDADHNAGSIIKYLILE
jgi:hypothetical protein